jgi:hypothetical protein
MPRHRRGSAPLRHHQAHQPPDPDGEHPDDEEDGDRRGRTRLPIKSRDLLISDPGKVRVEPSAVGKCGCRPRVDERLEHKPALDHARMRHGQARKIDHLVSVEQKVEVERAGAPAFASLPAVIVLDREETIQQLTWSKLGVDDDNAVEVGTLLRSANGRGLVER